MTSIGSKIYTWATFKARSPFAPLWLGLLFLFELILFIPLDAVLAFFCLHHPLRKFAYVWIATAASLCGGVFGYMVGHWAWDWAAPYVLGHLISIPTFDRVCHHYVEHQNSAVFLGSLLPFPFKVIALSAGVCHLAVIPFVASLVLARGARFLLVARAADRWGSKLLGLLERYGKHMVLIILGKLALVALFFWILGQ
jgi:membrane protein YqaA with SNARE-associated domain